MFRRRRCYLVKRKLGSFSFFVLPLWSLVSALKNVAIYVYKCSLEIDLVLISPQLGSFVSLMGGFLADQTIVISVIKAKVS